MSDGKEFTVYAKLLSQRLFSLKVSLSDTIGNVKQKIVDQEKIPFTQQNLLVNGVLLQPNNRLLSEFKIVEGQCIYVTAGRFEDFKQSGTKSLTPEPPNHQQNKQKSPTRDPVTPTASPAFSTIPSTSSSFSSDVLTPSASFSPHVCSSG